MATISASPNPVGVYSATVGSRTYVDWDTAPSPRLARLHVSTNGGAEGPGQPPAGATAATNVEVPVTFPNSYKLVLRTVPTGPDPNSVVLATLDVNTYDLRQDLGEDFSSAFFPQIRPQVIKNLAVHPGIDVVLVTFRTSKPTIPLIELRDENGTKIDARFPLLGGMQTEHQAFFGEDRPLALESKHSIRIVAAGGAKEVEATAEFITGSRKAEVVFDEVDIFDDSDPGLRGEGEFMFSFGAGDASTTAPLGEPWPDFGSIGLDPDDDHVPIDRKVLIPKAPRQLWVQALAYESDFSAWPPEWTPPFRSVPGFSPPGSVFESSDGHQEIQVTEFVDIDHDVGSAVSPFELSTTRYSIAFVMKGHVAVESKFGQSLTTKAGKKRPRPKAVAPLHEAGTVAFVAPAWGVEDAQIFAYGPDSALYYRAAAKPVRKPGGDWTRVELPTGGRPIIAANGPGSFDMILHRDDGGVMYSRKSGKAKPGAWRNLGGDFDQLVVAAEPAKGKTAEADVTLFGLARDGSLLARTVGAGEWQRVEQHSASAIAQAELPGANVVVSAGTDRRLRVHAKRGGKWRSQILDQPIPGRDRVTKLAVATLAASGRKGAGQDLIIGAMSDNDRVRILRWPDFPGGTPDSGWEDAGSLQDLFNAPRRPRKGRTPAAKPSAAPAKARGRKPKG